MPSTIHTHAANPKNIQPVTMRAMGWPASGANARNTVGVSVATNLGVAALLVALDHAEQSLAGVDVTPESLNADLALAQAQVIEESHSGEFRRWLETAWNAAHPDAPSE